MAKKSLPQRFPRFFQFPRFAVVRGAARDAELVRQDSALCVSIVHERGGVVDVQCLLCWRKSCRGELIQLMDHQVGRSRVSRSSDPYFLTLTSFG
jgi:hypothetical protein